MIINFNEFKLNENSEECSKSLTELTDIIMNGEERIYTAYGPKRHIGVCLMIQTYPTQKVVQLFINGNDYIDTENGRLSETGLFNLIMSYYDFEKENKIKDFNL